MSRVTSSSAGATKALPGHWLLSQNARKSIRIHRDGSGSIDCELAPGRLQTRDLVSLRAYFRRSRVSALKMHTSRSAHATLFGDEIEHYVSNLIAKRAGASARFMQWRLNQFELAQLSPRLADIRLAYLDRPDDTSGKFLAHVHEHHPGTRHAFFVVNTWNDDFMLLGASQLRDAGANWFAHAKGRRYIEFPDTSYGRWSSRIYAECLRIGAPRAHQVTIDLDLGAGRRYRQDYLRLALPFQDYGSLMSVVTFMTDLSLEQEIRRRPVA